MPPVFSRLAVKVRTAVSLGILLFIALPITTIILLQNAWEKTPTGAAEAREYEIERQRKTAEEEAQQRVQVQLRDREAAAHQAQEQQTKLESCFTTWGHRLPDLERAVKDDLGNPDSFKQLETKTLPADPDGYNVIIRFMAQNRMGAPWRFGLRASVDPESCSVTRIEPEPSES
jgi:hypothetical protein